MTQPSNVLFREIHKNAWLKKLQTVDKRNGAFPKKGERVWVVFCVHDDSEAFLEVYVDQKLAVAHKPDWFVSLNNCLHVSPTICAQEDEYEFVITLSSEIIRLAAPSWDIMMEWVETIRSKLQEMRILSPRENLYSKMPEARLPLAPTRDPNSPLPPTPMGPSARVPGIEPIHLENAVGVSQENSSPIESETESTAQTNGTAFEMRSTSALYITQSEPPVYTRPRHTLNRAVSVPDSSSTYNSSSLRASPGLQNSSNVTVIEVSATSEHVSHSAFPLHSDDVFNFSEIDAALQPFEDVYEEESNISSEAPAQSSSLRSIPSSEQPSGSRFMPISSRASEPESGIAIPGPSNTSSTLIGDEGDSGSNPNENCSRQEEIRGVCGAACRNRGLNASNETSGILGHYECVFLPSLQEPIVYTPVNTTSRSRTSEANSSPRTVSLNPVSESRSHTSLPSEQPSTSSSLSGVAVMRQRSRSTSLSEGSAARVTSSGDRNHIVASTSSGCARNELERRLQPPPHPYRYLGTSLASDSNSAGRLTLREQQVLQLRREMLHPGGVRLQLRRKDCTNSIALVDAFGAVWIAGWKQKEHPMLYNALHIGDHLVSTGGVLVQNASDAQKLIRGTSSLYVEFVIRRVPCGRVFAIRRDTEGQSLGIVQESNTAEIRDVVPGSPAARHGLVPRAPTCDGLSLTNWVLTEINGRPLNLFFKDGEVRDRLNAVGRDISILVQPADLVKQLKKQLKSIRSYKEYIVQ